MTTELLIMITYSLQEHNFANILVVRVHCHAHFCIQLVLITVPPTERLLYAFGVSIQNQAVPVLGSLISSMSYSCPIGTICIAFFDTSP